MTGETWRRVYVVTVACSVGLAVFALVDGDWSAFLAWLLVSAYQAELVAKWQGRTAEQR